MKMFVCTVFVASIAWWAACACHAADRSLLTERSGWGDLARFANPTEACPGGSLEQLRQRVGVDGPYSLSQREQLQSEAEAANQTAGPGIAIVWLYPVSDFIKQNLRAPSELYTFEFSTDPSESPWWGFRGLLIASEGCIIHAEITGFDHG